MIGNLSVLALVTARGGSRGLARKNLREVGGRSLLERAIQAGQGAQTVDRVVLSSDDPEIIRAALLAGCEVPFVRPPSLANDEARSIDVLRHALETLPERYDLLVLLQPTSPLRLAEDIDGAVMFCLDSGAPACVSVAPAAKTPYWMHSLGDRGLLHPILPAFQMVPRRQDLPEAYALNGAVFVAYCDWLMAHEDFLSPDTVGYVMPKERSVDIDDELDLVLAEAIESWLACDPDQAGESAAPAARLASSRS